MDIKKEKVKSIGVIESVNDRVATFVISSEIVDEDAEVLLIAGVDISSTKKGLRDIVWLDHKSDQPSAIITDIQKVGSKLISTIRFPDKPEDVELKETFLPDKAYAYAKAGLLKASLDFLAVEVRIPTKKDKEMFGDKAELVLSKTKLIGFSLTSMPANEEAQMIAIKALEENKISSKDLELIDIELPKTEEKIEEKSIEEVEEIIETPENIVEETPEKTEKELNDEKIEKAKAIIKNISQKKDANPHIISRRTDAETVKKQIAREMALRLAKKTGQIFID